MKTPIIPIDPNDWTIDDWRELHNGVEEIKRRIAARHDPTIAPPCDNAHVALGCEPISSPRVWFVCINGKGEENGVSPENAWSFKRLFNQWHLVKPGDLIQCV